MSGPERKQRRAFKSAAERITNSPTTSSPKTEVKVDLWSTRIASWSQIALVLLATFGYFYTVRPTYQKDYLEEEISKANLQLSAIQNDLKKKQSELERAVREVREHVVQTIILRVHRLCAGYFKIEHGDRGPDAGKPPWVRITRSQALSCLGGVPDNQDLSVLNSDERRVFDEAFSAIVAFWEQMREVAARKCEALSAPGSKLPEFPPPADDPDDEYRDRSQKILANPQSQEALVENACIGISSRYKADALDRVDQLKNTQWPDLSTAKAGK